MKGDMEPFYRRAVEHEALITRPKQVVKAKTVSR